MDASGKSAWGQRPPRVGGANGAPPGRGDGVKRQPKDPMGAPMGARKPHDGAGRRAPRNEGYSEEVATRPRVYPPPSSPPGRSMTSCLHARANALCAGAGCAHARIVSSVVGSLRRPRVGSRVSLRSNGQRPSSALEVPPSRIVYIAFSHCGLL